MRLVLGHHRGQVKDSCPLDPPTAKSTSLRYPYVNQRSNVDKSTNLVKLQVRIRTNGGGSLQT